MVSGKEFAALDQAQRKRLMDGAEDAAADALEVVARYRAAEAAALLRGAFPGARWVTFHLVIEHGHIVVFEVHGGDDEVLFDNRRDAWMPDSASEAYLVAAAEAGFPFREEGDRFVFDVIDVR